ncbi:MAG: hypothetical protein IH934_03920 [Nanoarchaeota archaeon]|nr:hypothetical protein [Nanoarchaeota archaeon]
MKFDLSNVRYSRNDLKWNIKIPDLLDTKLAFFLGIQVGDGYLKKVIRESAVDYCIMFEGHGTNELKWYNSYLKWLLKDLFNKDVKVVKSSRGTVQIHFRSKAAFTFLNQICDISESPKTYIRIPKMIMDCTLDIKRSFLRGLADADFSLTFKKRVKKDYYPVIFFQTYSKLLYKDTKKLLLNLGFRIVHNYRKSYRYDKVHDAYYIQISGRDQLNKWMKEVGFKSSNHITRYLVWKKLGYLPIGTDILERNQILNKEAQLGLVRPGPENLRY